MSTPLKVLYLIHDARRSGVPAVMANLICSLDRSRVIPSVLFAYEGIYAQELRAAGIEVHSLGRRIPLLWRCNRFLMNLRLLKLAKGVDVVHANSIKLLSSVLVAKWLGVKVVLHLHEKTGKMGRLLVKAMGMADCVVFCAENCAAHYARIPVSRKRTILNAVRVPKTALPAPDAGRTKIVMLGSINRNKGQDLLLEAFAMLPQTYAELYFYGTVGLSGHKFVNSLKRYVRENGLSERVFFPGPTNEAAKVYRQASLLVHSSLNECMSISVLEAMSFAVPVIANDIIGMDEIINDGSNGFLVLPGDLRALAERIGELLDNPALRVGIGRAGRNTVLEKFNMAARVEEFMELYETLVRNHAKSGLT